MKKTVTCLIAAVSFCALLPATAVARSSAYDGSWELAFVTQRGACDPTYNFTVNINQGIVTHPNLLKFKGNVARSGVVHASVSVGEKFASGSGKLSGGTGRGTWTGYAGRERCSGYWNAQRN